MKKCLDDERFSLIVIVAIMVGLYFIAMHYGRKERRAIVENAKKYNLSENCIRINVRDSVGEIPGRVRVFCKITVKNISTCFSTTNQYDSSNIPCELYDAVINKSGRGNDKREH